MNWCRACPAINPRLDERRLHVNLRCSFFFFWYTATWLGVFACRASVSQRQQDHVRRAVCWLSVLISLLCHIRVCESLFRDELHSRIESQNITRATAALRCAPRGPMVLGGNIEVCLLPPTDSQRQRYNGRIVHTYAWDDSPSNLRHLLLTDATYFALVHTSPRAVRAGADIAWDHRSIDSVSHRGHHETACWENKSLPLFLPQQRKLLLLPSPDDPAPPSIPRTAPADKSLRDFHGLFTVSCAFA